MSNRGTGGAPERRRSPRASVRVPGEIVAGPEAIAVSSVNLSAHGILCETPRPLPLFAKFRVEIEIPPFADEPGRRIPVEAVVVRSEESTPPGHHLAALFFEKIAAADRSALERFVLVHLPPASSHPA